MLGKDHSEASFRDLRAHLLAHVFLFFPFTSVVLKYWSEVALGEVPDDMASAQNLAKVMPEVLVKFGLLNVFRFQFDGIEGCHLLLLRSKVHRLTY